MVKSSNRGVAVLKWLQPVSNNDGSKLTDLAGYKIHYGTSPGKYTVTVDVGNVTSSAVSGLASGTKYYFAITAYDLSGNESAYSAVGSKVTQ